MLSYLIVVSLCCGTASGLRCFYCLQDAHVISSRMVVTPNSSTSGCPDSAPSALLNCPDDFFCVIEALKSRTKPTWTVTKGCRKPSTYDVHIDTCLLSSHERFYRCSCTKDYCNDGTAEELKDHLDETNKQKQTEEDVKYVNSVDNTEVSKSPVVFNHGYVSVCQDEPVIPQSRVAKSSLELNLTIKSDARNYIRHDEHLTDVEDHTEGLNNHSTTAQLEDNMNETEHPPVNSNHPTAAHLEIISNHTAPTEDSLNTTVINGITSEGNETSNETDSTTEHTAVAIHATETSNEANNHTDHTETNHTDITHENNMTTDHYDCDNETSATETAAESSDNVTKESDAESSDSATAIATHKELVNGHGNGTIGSHLENLVQLEIHTNLEEQSTTASVEELHSNHTETPETNGSRRKKPCGFVEEMKHNGNASSHST